MSPNPCLNSFYSLGDPVMVGGVDFRGRAVSGSVRGGWTVRASVADGPEPARTVRLVFADGLFSRVCSGGSVGFNGRSVASGRTVRVVLAYCPRHLTGLSTWALRTVRPTWPDSPPEAGSFVPWFDSSLLLSCFRMCFKESFLRLEVDP
jgi:hypothetical protein